MAAKQFPTWKGLNTLGVAIGYRRDSKGNESPEYRYYISSAAPDRRAVPPKLYAVIGDRKCAAGT